MLLGRGVAPQRRHKNPLPPAPAKTSRQKWERLVSKFPSDESTQSFSQCQAGGYLQPQRSAAQSRRLRRHPLRPGSSGRSKQLGQDYSRSRVVRIVPLVQSYSTLLRQDVDSSRYRAPRLEKFGHRAMAQRRRGCGRAGSTGDDRCMLRYDLAFALMFKGR
jgi:hypothetical protein